MKTLMLSILFMFISLNSINSYTDTYKYNKLNIDNETIFIKESLSDSVKDRTVDSLLFPNKYIKKIGKKGLSITEFQLDSFKNKLGYMESGNRYDISNRYGYLGKYQFSKKTLRRLILKGYLDYNLSDVYKFRKDKVMQEKAMDALVQHNLDILYNYNLSKFIGKNVGGVKVTVEGLLAGAHLLGPYAVSHFLKTGGSMETVSLSNGVKIKKYDGNNTSIKKYMKAFV